MLIKRLKFMKKLLENEKIIIAILFLIWKALLLAVSAVSVQILELRGRDFFGGGYETYITMPFFYGWANFDGEHYLSIANIGYKGLEQAFFPLYPILMNFFANPFGHNIFNLVLSGLLISNFCFLIALIILYKLILLDYSKKIAYLTIISILVFPTSFYFGALYNESLFLLLTVTSFYLMRKNRLFWASILGFLSSTSRIFGILLTGAFSIEVWKNKFKLSFLSIFLIPLGLALYMYYQWITVGDPLAFYHLQKIVGPQHESGITLLPQVYFRYIKIILTTQITNPIYITMVLEVVIGLLFFILPIIGFFKKMRKSYIFYALVGFLLPTIQGSFSSVPRYVIVFFPSFIVLAILLSKFRIITRVSMLIFSAIWLIINTALFFRGYWVA